MQQRVSERSLLPEIGRLTQKGFQRMTWGQRVKRRDEIADALVGRADAETFRKLLQHVHAGSSVWCIHHQMHNPIRLEDAAQSCETSVGIGEMMENTGADDLIEGSLQLV